ncbi:hypothetical protein TL16_g02193 [Triparma laevis f. inornata]|uniref:Uncharacterized protein n=1 Tax=Triparma laevis f. inornata TaxID=1714386 RepID=A0A9W7DVN2_9STRA|nr:hypothetical protein TL16_g02193 [Triparma laevis f. inornata]
MVPPLLVSLSPPLTRCCTRARHARLSFDIVKNGELLRENVKKFDSRSHGFIGDVSFMDRLYSESIVGIPIATIVASGEGAKFLVFDGKKVRE